MSGSLHPSSKSVRGRRWLFSDCEYLELSRQLIVAGEPVKMESKPLDVLQVFLEQPNEIHTRDEILRAAWEIATSDQSVATAVSKLRKAFRGPRDRILISISGVGYRMAVPVVCVEENALPERLALKPGDPMPGRESWLAVRSLDHVEDSMVWLAAHGKTHEQRVFKFAMDGIRLRALQREVALSRLFALTTPDDPRFVRILDWNFNEKPYRTEAEFGGLDLHEFSATDDFKAMGLDARVRMVADITAAVARAHELGVLHNDLKPSNILLLRRPEFESEQSNQQLRSAWQVKVADFGVASLQEPQRLRDLEITDHGQFVEEGPGSPGYARGSAMYRAPEQRLPGMQPSTKADLFALGVMLYQVVRGDLLMPLAPGWEMDIADPLLREDIAAAANVDPDRRLGSAAELTSRLINLSQRHAQRSQAEQERLARQHEEEALARERMLRPWILFAMGALLLGIFGTLWFYRRAIEERNAARRRSAALASMNKFLSVDLLSQANPLTTSHGGPVPQETLVESINRVLPKIDSRFAKDPEIAGTIHETLASAFGARSHYGEAFQQFTEASRSYRLSEGPQSQKALIADLRRTSLLLMMPTATGYRRAQEEFTAEQKLLTRIPHPSPELEGWKAMVETALMTAGTSPPDAAIPELRDAIKQGEATPGYDPALLNALRLRSCGVYLKLNRGAEAADVARRAIATLTAEQGADSPALFAPEIDLEQALFIDGKYREAAAQSAVDLVKFSRLLGPDSQYTWASLDMRAQSENAMGNDPASIRDWTTLYTMTSANPSARFFSQTAIVSAGQLECHDGELGKGEATLRQALHEIVQQNGRHDLNYSVGSLALAECLLSEQERSARVRTDVLNEVGQLLAQFELPTVERFAGVASAEGNLDCAKGWLAFLQKDNGKAQQYATQAEPFLHQLGADPWEQQRLVRLQNRLQGTSAGRAEGTGTGDTRPASIQRAP